MDNTNSTVIIVSDMQTNEAYATFADSTSLRCAGRSSIADCIDHGDERGECKGDTWRILRVQKYMTWRDVQPTEVDALDPADEQDLGRKIHDSGKSRDLCSNCEQQEGWDCAREEIELQEDAGRQLDALTF